MCPFCDEYSIPKEAIQALNAHDDLLAALEAIEWAGGASLSQPDSCPRCHNSLNLDEGRHHADCQLAAALRKGRAE